MKKYLKYLLAGAVAAVSLLAFFSSCSGGTNYVASEGTETTSGAENKGWPNRLTSGQVFTDYGFYKNYVDESVKPGDDFYQYALGKNSNAGFPIKTEQDKITDKLVSFKKYVIEQYNSDILTTVRTKYNALGNAEAKKTLLKNYITTVENSTDDELIEIVAKNIVYGINFFTPKIAYDGRVPMILMGLTNQYQDLISYLRSGTLESVEQIVNNYNRGYKDEYKTAKIAAIKEILDYNDTACINSVNTVMQNFSTDKGIEPSNNPLLTKINELFSASELSIPVHAEMFNNFSAFKLIPGEGSITSTNVKNLIKLTYLMRAYDFLFIDDSTKYPYPRALYTYLPFRFIAQKAFKEKYDPTGAAKTYIDSMCEEVRKKFIERLENNTWMTESTKSKAIEKARNIIFFVGYANDLNKPTLLWNGNAPSSDDYLELIFELNRKAIIEYAKLIPASITDYETKREILCYNASTQEDLLQINAFYTASVNGIFILPIWLTEPGTNVEYADAYNYGNFGSVLGHELCHAFDSEGSTADENGNTTDWWSSSDKLRYEEKKTQMTQLFSTYTSKSGTYVDGAKTLAENMADFGGLTTIYDLFVSKKIKEGFTGEELKNQKKMFFQSFSFFYESTATNAEIDQLMAIDTHSPNTVRVNVNTSLIDDWYEVYGVEEGDKYYLAPSQRIILW